MGKTMISNDVRKVRIILSGVFYVAFGSGEAMGADQGAEMLNSQWRKSQVFAKSADGLWNDSEIESREKAIELDRQNQANDLRSKQGLMGNSENKAVQLERARKAESEFQAYQSRQFSVISKKVLKSQKKDFFSIVGRSPATVVAGTGALALGHTLEMGDEKDTQFKLTSQAVKQRGRLEIQNSNTSGFVGVSAYKGNLKGRHIPMQRDLEISRGISSGFSQKFVSLGITSRVAFESENSGVSASVSKELAKNLSLVMDSRRGSNGGSNQGSVQVVFGVSF